MSMAVPSAMACAHSALLARPEATTAQGDALLAAAARVARQNLYGSLAWHLLMTPLALAGWVAPWLAAITMLLSSLAVAGNAWRLRRHRWDAAPAAAVAQPAP
ncbi:Copper-exporting P-type ATPase A [Bordetella pertussis]|nr:Copper-exporting P-type ATPase A [Bordetella pertussis]CPQ76311.1 Copper-exporting P-type ATPase A [Bordetella pertussis]CPQ86954.1 Copper-exporting P-type ATPase A [Bordetella pertussis]CPQ96804.1 Copper-exporting P-type ATPase A [Bordetella pertussis]